MTERWGYVVALPLYDYYDDDMWGRVFPPEDGEAMLKGFWFDGHWIPVEIDPGAKWIEMKDPHPCPDCEAIRRDAFNRKVNRLLRAYHDGLAATDEHDPA